ncbi:MAG TPA: MBL fold metallo-hydrolase [Thermoanaerobaculia bacterium]|nr:MBL fold metallo-hydrolase [Thermoanaerobaculia bacterium]
MFAAALGSGSGGNCYLFENDGTSILVDAGFGTRETRKRLAAIDRSIESIQAILLTHEHYDHIRGAARLAAKHQIPVYLTAGTLAASTIDPTTIPVRTFENNSSFRLGDFCIHARRTLHDAADPACFVIEAGDGTRVGLATDLGHVDQPVIEHLQQCDALFFESNHDLDMLRTGTYPWSLKRRIMSRFGHLSNDDSIGALQRLLGAELRSLCMIHLSEKNNHESIVRSMTGAFLERAGVRLDLHIARQDRPSASMEIARRSVRRSTMRGAPLQQLSLF